MALSIDLGCGVKLFWFSFAPSRSLNPQYEGIPDVEKFGARLEHKTPQGEECNAAITFDGEVARLVKSHPLWSVETWDPLTVSPSILCRCGFHGFIKAGKWIPV